MEVRVVVTSLRVVFENSNSIFFVNTARTEDDDDACVQEKKDRKTAVMFNHTFILGSMLPLFFSTLNGHVLLLASA